MDKGQEPALAQLETRFAGHSANPTSQSFTTWFIEVHTLKGTLLEPDEVPPKCVKGLLEPIKQAFSHDPVERLSSIAC